MNSVKVVLLVVAALSCFALDAYALRCYSCTGISSCKTPKKYDCNFATANQSLTYLNFHYQDVPQSSSNNYVCFADNFKAVTGEYSYSGCLFAEVQSCSLRLSTTHGEYYSRCCSQCRSDYCNPAGRASPSLMTALGAIVLAVAAKRLLF